MDNLKNYIILKETKPEDMIIKNIVACATLIFIIRTAQNKKSDSLKRLLTSTGFVPLLFLHHVQTKKINDLPDKKIVGRAGQFHASHAVFAKGLQDVDVRLTTISRSVAKRFKQIKDLCGTGWKEVSDPVGRSYREIDSSLPGW